jgi:CYTH domain-containing protein
METERKFLVMADKTPPLQKGALIEQGYLVFQNPPEVPVELRLRRVNKADCFLTVKSGNAPARIEVELTIAPDQFSELWPLTEGRRVFKRRYRIPIVGGLTAELDIYEGVRAGLQVVEVEFSSESQARAFTPPPWFGQEVTRDTRYTNAELAG